jgi:hypothetical protein
MESINQILKMHSLPSFIYVMLTKCQNKDLRTINQILKMHSLGLYRINTVAAIAVEFQYRTSGILIKGTSRTRLVDSHQ